LRLTDFHWQAELVELRLDHAGIADDHEYQVAILQ
jgi:hypothetical protein